MAKAQGLSRMAVQRIWKKYNIQPHHIKTFKLSNDPHFIEKVQDVVGLYLNPPDKALVLSVDENKSDSGIGSYTAGITPEKGPCRHQTHDYKRYGKQPSLLRLTPLTGK